MIKRIKIVNRKDFKGSTVEQILDRYSVVPCVFETINGVPIALHNSWVYSAVYEITQVFATGRSSKRLKQDFYSPYKKDEPVEYEFEVILEDGNSWILQIMIYSYKIFSEAILCNNSPVAIIDRENDGLDIFQPSLIPDLASNDLMGLLSDYPESIILNWTDIGRKIRSQFKNAIIIKDWNLSMYYDSVDIPNPDTLLMDTIRWYDERYPGMNTKKLLEALLPVLDFHYDQITEKYELRDSKTSCDFPLSLCGSGLERVIHILPALYVAGMYNANVFCPDFSRSLHPLLSKRLLEFFKLRNKGQLVITYLNFKDNV